MSGHDVIDEGFDDLVSELRSGEPTASPELRDRVRAVANRKAEPRAPRLSRFRQRRRLVLVLAPVACLLAAAVGVGVFTSSGSTPRSADGAFKTLRRVPAPPPKRASANYSAATGGATGSRDTLTGQLALPQAHSLPATTNAAKALAPSGSRAQIYGVDVVLRVSDLSSTTKQAIGLTRGWGGYLVSVDYGSGSKSGEAYMVLRIPIVKVQTAVAKLTALGTIITDHVSIQDVQGQLNKRYSQMQALKVKIANLRAKLTDTTLTTSQRAFFQAALTQRLAQLGNFQQAQAAEKTRVSFATISLDLRTKQAAAVVPSKPGRIGRALSNIGRVLVVEAEVLVYILLIGGPFVLVAILLWASRRSLRRRSEEQLLAR
ncbi:MAG TPA: DUF4349 domain-containing protein [Gaiellaceae bacterium]|nr:DUF4349 domain-containing protein [Gaiellaceae bacterium]